MFLASRPLSAAILAARRDGNEQVRETVRAYEIRARFRPTPHGVFAGVADVRFTDNTGELGLGGNHRARSAPSPAWLTAVSHKLIESPEVFPLLRFTTSNLVTRRGPRLEHEQQSTPGVAGPQQVRIRATEASLLVLRLCEAGATYPEVASEVTRKWPNVPETLVRSMLLEMVHRGFLLTNLLPDSADDDPLGHLLNQLPDACALRGPLVLLRSRLQEADRHPPGARTRLKALVAARDLCDEVTHQERPLTVDVAADARLVLPASLADEAAEAASVLWQVGRGLDPGSDYHARFVERYGPNRLVPLLEVADPVVGLGPVEAKTVIAIEPMTPEHLAILATLLSEAIAHHRTEVVLDTATIEALSKHQPDLPAPPSAEIYVRLVAASAQDLAASQLRLAVCPGGGTQQAGSSLGRFASLLPNASPGTFASMSSSALVAELAIRPRAPELTTIATPTGFSSVRIPVGLPARENDLDLADLLLVSNGDRLMLWSAVHDRQVLPMLYSRIGPRYLPPIARLLQQLGLHGCGPWFGWSWGPLENGPFQPRVRYNRTILCPARWRLPTALIEAARDSGRWHQALDAWRGTAIPPPPDIVVTEDADRQLPLDLRKTYDRELLRRYVRRGVGAVMEEPGGPDAVQAVVSGPTGRHVLEVVVPLVSQAPAPAKKRWTPVIDPRPTGDGLYLPGSEWLSFAIPAPHPNQDDILTAIAQLIAELADDFGRWFWLRYNNVTHGPHLRVRFHGDPAVLGSKVLPAVSAWCTDLITQRLASGFTVEPYDQEIERYGGREAIRAAERVFDADSHLVLATLAATRDPDKKMVVAALSAATIARSVADSAPAALEGRRLDRSGRRRADVLRPLVRSAAQAASAVVPETRPMWLARQEALDAYHDHLHEEQRPSCASSLVHMHANRLLGDAATERIVRALAADLLAREGR